MLIYFTTQEQTFRYIVFNLRRKHKIEIESRYEQSLDFLITVN